MLENFSRSLQSIFDLYKQKRNSYFGVIITFFALLFSFTIHGQTTLSKNQLRYIYDRDTVIYTFKRDISGKLKYVLFTSKNDDKNVKPSTLIFTYDDTGLLDQVGGSLMGIEKKDNETFYFNSSVKIINKIDSLNIFLEDRHLYKSKNRSISRMNTGTKADGFSSSKMIFSGRITSNSLYLTCDGIGCQRQLFLFEKVHESEIKSTKK